MPTTETYTPPIAVPASINRMDEADLFSGDTGHCMSSVSSTLYEIRWEEWRHYSVTFCDCVAFSKSKACRHAVFAQYVLDVAYHAMPDGAELREVSNEQEPCACGGIVIRAIYYKPQAEGQRTSGYVSKSICNECGRSVVL